MPVYHEVEQNSPEWFALRSGKPTASGAAKLLTPKTGKLSSQAAGYMYQLLAESLVGYKNEFSNEWTERGHELEPQAVTAYEMLRDVTTKKSGLWTNDAGTVCCSLDREIDADGILEIKCPAANTHVKYMLDKSVDETYNSQLQCQMYVTGRKYVDICSYCPGLPLVIIRVERDEEYIAKLDAALTEFLTRYHELKSQLSEQIA